MMVSRDMDSVAEAVLAARADPFASDRDRVEHLFTPYAELADPLGTAGAKANRKVAKRAVKSAAVAID